MQIPSDEYLIYQIQSAESKARDGFHGVSQDLIISSVSKYADYSKAIGKIILYEDQSAEIILKDKKNFSILEKLTKIFEIDKFSISVSEDLGSTAPKVQKSQPKQEEPPKQTARIDKKSLFEVFSCPHLTSQEDELSRGNSPKDAYNCLFPDKICPLQLPCKEPQFLQAVGKYVDFNKHDLYVFEFLNNGKKYDLAISKTNTAVIPHKD